MTLHRELFFPPVVTLVRESKTPLPPQIYQVLRNTCQILSHTLDEDNITKFLSFLQRNVAFFEEYFSLMRRPWDFDAEMVERWLSYQHVAQSSNDAIDNNEEMDNYVAKASDDPEIAKYFPIEVLNISNAVLRTYWHMIMKIEVIPKALDRVDLWMDFMSIFGLQNREIVRNLSLKWLILEKNGEIATGKRNIKFSQFWNQISEKTKNSCLRLVDILEKIGDSTIQNAEEVVSPFENEIFSGLRLLYDATFMMRTAFEICPAFVWLAVDHKVQNTKQKFLLLHWMFVFYEFGLEFIRTRFIRTERTPHYLLPFWIEQSKQNILSIIHIFIKEMFLEVPMIVANSKDTLSSILQNRYFVSLQKSHTSEKLEELINLSFLKDNFMSFFDESIINRRQSVKNSRELFVSTIQSLTIISRNFCENSNVEHLEKVTSFGKAIAEYEYYFGFIESLNDIAKKDISFENDSALLIDIVRTFEDIHSSSIAMNEIPNIIPLPNTKLEKLQAKFPQHDEQFIQLCLNFENGNYLSTLRMVESGNLPFALNGIVKYKSTTNPKSQDEYIPSPSSASDFSSPAFWEDTNIFSNVKVQFGKKKTYKLNPISEALQQQIIESYQYDDEYDDTYDDTFQIAAVETEEVEDDISKVKRGGNQSIKQNKYINQSQGRKQDQPADNQSNVQKKEAQGQFKYGNKFKPRNDRAHGKQFQEQENGSNLNQQKNQKQDKHENEELDDIPNTNYYNPSPRGRGSHKGKSRGKVARRQASKKFMTSLHGT